MENDSKFLGFRADEAEQALIDREAAGLGMNRTDYLRYKTIPPNGGKQTASDATEANIGNLEGRLNNLEALVKHGIYLANQIYVALFSIAEVQARTGRFLSIEQLDAVHTQVRADALLYAVEFPESFAAVQAEIAAANQKAKA